jgi:hypothetical protein
MKQLIVINVHSFVDLITNSSSELFICDSGKSLETVKDILTGLIVEHNASSESKISADHLFGGILNEPRTSEFTFNYTTFPRELREEYEKYHEIYWLHDWSTRNANNFRNSARYKEFEAKAKKVGEKYDKLDQKSLSEEEKNELRRKEWDEEAEVWRDFARDGATAELNLFKWWLKTNEFDDEQLAKVVLPEPLRNMNEHVFLSFEDDKINDAHTVFVR